VIGEAVSHYRVLEQSANVEWADCSIQFTVNKSEGL
jgi:hypothetical protein